MQLTSSTDAGDRLEIRHAGAPGRVRVHVRGLDGSADSLLGAHIAARADINDVRVSSLTGNITVGFSPATDVGEILAHIRSCLDRVEAGDEAGETDWHIKDVDEVAARLGVTLNDGLSYRKAARRLREYGPNTLISAPTRSYAEILWAQFSGAPVLLLAGAAGYSLYFGAVAEAVAIGAVLTVNAGIGFLTEARAEASIAGLLQAETGRTRAIREGKETEVDARDLVPGEVILVERGDAAPADARIAQAIDLSVSEAALTGESMPVRKTAKRLAGASLPLADRANMLYRGTIIVSGSGKAIVTATGANTEIGRIQRLATASRPPETPTHTQLAVLGGQLVWLVAGASALLVAFGLLRGLGAAGLMRSAISLAVASIPEGLPMIATVSHAVGVDEMRKRNVIVRRPEALETLAAVDVVCLDKTGTLTANQMSVAEVDCGGARISGQDALQASDARPSDPVGRLLRVAALCNEAEVNGGERVVSFSGSATETALLSAAVRYGIDVKGMRGDNPREWIGEWNGGSRFMASRHEGPSGPFLAMKGAPLEVLRRCSDEFRKDGSRRALTIARCEQIERDNADMASRGLRVLGFACGGEAFGSKESMGSIGGLSWVGLAGLEDPVRENAGEAVRLLRKSGIRPLILTGDQFLTARAVAERVGVETSSQGAVVDAAGLETLSLDELARVVKEASVLARITPEQKLRVVEALQRSGSVVAMVGDGINDSPALRKADVGVALSTRADAAARDVADVVLQTDDLRTVAQAVAQGRAIYGNVRKALSFLLSTNSSEVLLLLGATLAGHSEVLTPMQLLWINLITDVAPGVGLAVEGPEPSVLAQPPSSRRTEFLSSGEARELLRDGAFLALSGVAAGVYGAARYGVDSGQTRTLIFTGLIAAQLDHALTCRSERAWTAQDLPPNRALNFILAGSAAAQSLALLTPGLRRLLGLAPLGLIDTAAMLAASAVPAVLRRMFLAWPRGGRGG